MAKSLACDADAAPLKKLAHGPQPATTLLYRPDATGCKSPSRYAQQATETQKCVMNAIRTHKNV